MPFFLGLLGMLPYAGVLLAGVVIALATLRRHPLVSVLALVGYGGLFLLFAARPLLWHLAPGALATYLPMWAWSALGMVQSLLGALCLALAGAAVFVGRLGLGSESP